MIAKLKGPETMVARGLEKALKTKAVNTHMKSDAEVAGMVARTLQGKAATTASTKPKAAPVASSTTTGVTAKAAGASGTAASKARLTSRAAERAVVKAAGVGARPSRVAAEKDSKARPVRLAD
jgi:hypothetical protein